MTLTKLVNGVRQNLTASEQLDRETESQANKDAKDEFELNFGYIQKRRDAYPPIQDQLEAIIAALIVVRDDNQVDDFPQSVLDMLTNIETINAANPPPSP